LIVVERFALFVPTLIMTRQFSVLGVRDRLKVRGNCVFIFISEFAPFFLEIYRKLS